MSHEESYWMPDGGIATTEDIVIAESIPFGDGCEKVAEGVIWDIFSGTYQGVSDARFVKFSEYIEHPTYDGIV